MAELEEMVRMHVNAAEWIKLKKFDEHQIAVCLYHPMTEENKMFVVQAFHGLGEDTPFQGRFRIRAHAITERKFKRKDKNVPR